MEQAETEPEIATVGTKGQIVIPKRLRRELKITSKSKIILQRVDDKIVLTKLQVPPVKEELLALFNEADKEMGGKKVSEKEILDEIQKYRIEKRAK